jgi:hypothetical protein
MSVFFEMGQFFSDHFIFIFPYYNKRSIRVGIKEIEYHFNYSIKIYVSYSLDNFPKRYVIL